MKPRSPMSELEQTASSKPEDYVIMFGKHRGKTLWEIALADPLWIDWAQDRISDSLVRMKCQQVAMIPEVRRRIDLAIN